ncbi:hypothetical protein [Flavobacterium faecale]|uniref:hypothetical protein n=1 Tax=Flavobacterium faecale TaxID=1355330 RepID=UPI003AB04C04
MMKYSVVFVLVCFNIVVGQTSSKVGVEPEINIHAVAPIHFGDNYLSKANNPDVGFAVNLMLAQFQKIKLGLGYDYLNYLVTDISKAGNYQNSRYHSVYGILAYDIKFSKELFLEPYVGLGSVNLKFKDRNRSFGEQSGMDFRIGCKGNYSFDRTISAFVGVGYVATKYDVHTNPEFVSFYDNSKMLQLIVGLRFNLYNK